MRHAPVLRDLARPGLLMALVALGFVATCPLPARPAAPATAASQCRAGETVLYTCRFGPPARAAIGSVCGSAGAVHYRYGPAGRPALDLPSAADWSNVHTGQVRGQGAGGWQEHVRFSTGATHYIVFRGTDGALASRPGRSYSGIAVQGPGVDRTLACPGGARIAPSLVEAVTERAPPEAELGEAADGPFDAWF